MITVFLWAAVYSLSGQDKFGIKAGINRSTLNFEGRDYAYSFNAGVYAEKSGSRTSENSW